MKVIYKSKIFYIYIIYVDIQILKKCIFLI